jgi:hypothetical protein
MNESFILFIHATARVVVILTATFAISKRIHPTSITPSPVSVLGIVDIASVPRATIIAPMGAVIATCFTPYSIVIYHSEVVVDSADEVATLTCADTITAYMLAHLVLIDITGFLLTRYTSEDLLIFHIVSFHKLPYEFHTVGSA